MKELNLKSFIIWGIALLFCLQFVGDLQLFDSPPFYPRIHDSRIVLVCLAKCAVVLCGAYLVHRWMAKKSKSNSDTSGIIHSTRRGTHCKMRV
jgi:hypothetical protein